ncbi:MAG: hypothetical protein US54_C0031G0007 [Candidatus Roizmanbacteria bacterium GW2011_GWA2_37_7]|uniref:SpoVT-AbrB domain-containing protein n=1 Tax=Candidatus Roizmanbacteria bacterium GW2011_GWA2_37_7 TaxID=1618481 RepID=A0A0G0KAD8_9BACT|nr:MAG: hypothetical protein US54_C0031G0007 [Candidatus Roizmanbacteria bacterium GW2011_GWA2_37_7]
MQTVSITPKWQVHIPVAIRRQLGLSKPIKADIFVEGKKIVMQPKRSKIFKLEGALKKIKPTKRINIDRVRDYIDYSQL